MYYFDLERGDAGSYTYVTPSTQFLKISDSIWGLRIHPSIVTMQKQHA